MAKKSVMDRIQDVSENIGTKVVSAMKDRTSKFKEDLEERIIRLEEKLLNKALGTVCFGAAIIFFASGLVFFLRDFLSLNDTSSFVIVGILLLLLGMFLRRK